MSANTAELVAVAGPELQKSSRRARRSSRFRSTSFCRRVTPARAKARARTEAYHEVVMIGRPSADECGGSGGLLRGGASDNGQNALELAVDFTREATMIVGCVPLLRGMDEVGLRYHGWGLRSSNKTVRRRAGPTRRPVRCWKSQRSPHSHRSRALDGMRPWASTGVVPATTLL